MLIVLPAALLVSAVAVDETLEMIGAGWSRARSVYMFVTSGLLIGLVMINLWAYYGDFVGQCRYGGDLAGRFAAYLGDYAQSAQQGSQVYLLSDDVFLYGTHASATFLSGGRTITNVPEPIEGWPGVAGDTVSASPDADRGAANLDPCPPGRADRVRL